MRNTRSEIDRSVRGPGGGDAAPPLGLAPPPTGVLRMAAPLVVSFWMRSLFGFVDTIYAATLGDHAVAAIGLSIPFEFIMVAVWVGLSTGLTSALARAMGAGEGEKVHQYLAAAWRTVLAVSPFFLVLGALSWPLAPLIAPDPQTARAFAVYGSVLIAGSALTMFWSVIPDSIVKAHHDTRATMWAGVWSNVINVALNTLFTFVFHWGMFGIALSTVLGRFGGLAYALRKASRHESARIARGTDNVSGRDPRPYRSILALALPAALAYCLMAVEGGVVNLVLKSVEHPTEAIAAHGIFYRVLQFTLMPAIAAAVAMLPFVARRFGERDLASVARALREAHVAGALYAALAAPILFAAAPALAGALSSTAHTREFATLAIRLVPIGCLASIPFFLCRPTFEGLGRGRPGLLMAILRYLVLSAPSCWLGVRLAHAIGVAGLYGVILGLFTASGISSVVFLAWTRRTLRTERRLAETSPARLPAVEL